LRREEGKLTAMNVPGRNIMVSSAIEVMLVLSRFISAANSMLLSASSCVLKWKIMFITTSFRPR
jgi:hypothetical protein